MSGYITDRSYPTAMMRLTSLAKSWRLSQSEYYPYSASLAHTWKITEFDIINAVQFAGLPSILKLEAFQFPLPATMPLSPANTAYCCVRAIRSSLSTSSVGPSAISRATAAASQRPLRAPSRRCESTSAAAAAANPKISNIVDQISQLTLLETADLVSNLKVRFPQSHLDFHPTSQNKPPTHNNGQD